MASGSPRALAPEDGTILAVERALLGGVLLSQAAKMPPLLPSEFFLERHRILWATLLEMAQTFEHPDLISLQHELARRNELDAVGGSAALAGLLEEGALHPHLLDYARQVRQAGRARELQRIGAELLARGMDERQVQQALGELPGPMASALFDPAENWAQIVAGWQRTTKILTGLGPLDAMTGGVALGDLMVVAGRTSHGKTAFLCQLARAFAEQGVPTELFTIEETPNSVVRRLVANLTGLSNRKLREGDLSDSEHEAAEVAVQQIQALPLTVTGLDTLRTLDEETILGATSHSSAKVILVDHLQKVETRGESRVYGLERVTNRLHTQAIRDERAVILAVQIGRDMEQDRRPPRLSDIRDCGAVEILARSAWLLYWPWKHKPERDWHEYECYVAKQTDGGTGLVPLRFEAPPGRFSA